MIEDIRNPNDELLVLEKRIKALEGSMKAMSDKLNEVIACVNRLSDVTKETKND